MKITTNIPSHGNGQIQNPDAVPSQGRADLQQNGELSLANAAKGSVFQGNVIDKRKSGTDSGRKCRVECTS